MCLFEREGDKALQTYEYLGKKAKLCTIFPFFLLLSELVMGSA